MNALAHKRFYTLRAWMVHFYTSLGLIMGLFAIGACFQNNPQMVYVWLFISMFIDSTDGTLARSWAVTTWTPQFDGRKLDDITDYITYVLVPMIFAYRFGVVEGNAIIVLGIVLICGVYGFCQKAAKTKEGYFTGFPNFWNILVLYMYLLHGSPTVNAAILFLFSILVFVPITYVSFSTKFLRPLTMIMAAAYGVVLFVIIATFNNPIMPLVYSSLIFPLYYFVLSFYLFFKEEGSSIFLTR
jgi:phosphatidylcholine synthase